MELRVLGSSPPYPSPGVATSSYLVSTANTKLLVECGHGAVAVLRQALALNRLDGVVVSHMHPDHFYDLIPLRNSFLHEDLPRIPIYLPRRGTQILDAVVRATELPEDYMTSWFDLIEFDECAPFSVGDLTMHASRTVHPIETFAITFDCDGRRLVHSSDTAWFSHLPALFANANLGLVEVTDYPHPHGGSGRSHLDPDEVARLLQESRLPRAVLTHYEHAYEHAIHERVNSQVDGVDIEMARPGRTFRL
jgi:ribonuclease BN (tRNA processing enzyme)